MPNSDSSLTRDAGFFQRRELPYTLTAHHRAFFFSRVPAIFDLGIASAITTDAKVVVYGLVGRHTVAVVLYFNDVAEILYDLHFLVRLVPLFFLLRE